MYNKKNGCVYFFRHIGLSPVKIGFSSHESPINRFNQFCTFAPYGSEMLGFIISSDYKDLETKLHKRFNSKRLIGEWFDITEEEVLSIISLYSEIENVKNKNDFELAWAKKIQTDNNSSDIIDIEIDKFSIFKKLFIIDNNLNRVAIAKKLNVSRKTIHKWINKINKEQK